MPRKKRNKYYEPKGITKEYPRGARISEKNLRKVIQERSGKNKTPIGVQTQLSKLFSNIKRTGRKQKELFEEGDIKRAKNIKKARKETARGYYELTKIRPSKMRKYQSDYNPRTTKLDVKISKKGGLLKADHKRLTYLVRRTKLSAPRLLTFTSGQMKPLGAPKRPVVKPLKINKSRSRVRASKVISGTQRPKRLQKRVAPTYKRHLQLSAKLKGMSTGATVHTVSNIRARLEGGAELSSKKVGLQKKILRHSRKDAFAFIRGQKKQKIFSGGSASAKGKSLTKWKAAARTSKMKGVLRARKSTAVVKGRGRVKTILAMGVIMTGKAAFKFFKAGGKGRWITAKGGRRIFIKG